MLTALFADIHANRQAFEACLADAQRRGATRFVLLGDYVGYGGDPEWVSNKVLALIEAGALALRGNHDAALTAPAGEMNPQAEAALRWTRGVLSLDRQKRLAGLPLTLRQGDVLFTHADASQPSDWIYVADADDAARSLRGTDAMVVVCGHIHKPALYSQSAAGRMTSFRPVDDVPIHLSAGRRWHVVCGAVGQPRDGRPAAAWTLFDPQRRDIVFCRTAYDIDAAARAITDNSLPAWLAERLYLGK